MEKSLCVAIPENAMSLMHIIFDQIKCFTKIFSIYLYMILSIFIYNQNTKYIRTHLRAGRREQTQYSRVRGAGGDELFL